MKEIIVKWKGEEYPITEDRAFEVADALEEIVTVFELHAMVSDIKALKVNKLARAFAALLTELGAKATPREVRSAIVDGLKGQGDASQWGTIAMTLLSILFDGLPEGEGETEGNAETPAENG